MHFLHRLDTRSRTIQTVETSVKQLRAATFLDGREKFWTAEQVAALPQETGSGERCSRFVFHVGFCGSTLLARMLDRPGAALALKEPQCLTDIASQKALLTQEGETGRIPAAIDYALRQLGRVSSDETIFIKPSNWVNGLLPEISRQPDAGRAIFLSIDARGFLLAAFRGGRDRLAFCARLAQQLAHVERSGEALLQQAIAASEDPLTRAAYICAYLHAAQEALFRDASSSAHWDATLKLDYRELASDPASTLEQSAQFLGLPDIMHTSADFAALSSRHAKDPARTFSKDRRKDEDREVERHHPGRFDAALEWMAAQDFAVS